MRTSSTGQKDLKKLYWERELETLAVKTYGTYATNWTSSRHMGKYLDQSYFIGAISLCRLIVGC